jgi:hypothetical protein
VAAAAQHEEIVDRVVRPVAVAVVHVDLPSTHLVFAAPTRIVPILDYDSSIERRRSAATFYTELSLRARQSRAYRHERECQSCRTD